MLGSCWPSGIVSRITSLLAGVLSPVVADPGVLAPLVSPVLAPEVAPVVARVASPVVVPVDAPAVPVVVLVVSAVLVVLVPVVPVVHASVVCPHALSRNTDGAAPPFTPRLPKPAKESP